MLAEAEAQKDGERLGDVDGRIAAEVMFELLRQDPISFQPGMLGAAFFLVTALLPPLLVTHALIFRLLARRQTATEPLRRQQRGHVEVPSRPVR